MFRGTPKSKKLSPAYVKINIAVDNIMFTIIGLRALGNMWL